MSKAKVKQTIVVKNAPPARVEPKKEEPKVEPLAPEVKQQLVAVAKHYIRRPSESHTCYGCGDRCSDNGPQVLFCPEDGETLCLNCAK